MALIVKSRRARSAAMSSTKITLSGAPPVGIRRFAAQRGDLVRHAADDARSPCRVRSRREDTREEAHHLFGLGVGRDVPVAAPFCPATDRVHTRPRSSLVSPRRSKARADADRVAIDAPDEPSEVDFRGHFLGLSRRSALARSWKTSSGTDEVDWGRIGARAPGRISCQDFQLSVAGALR